MPNRIRWLLVIPAAIAAWYLVVAIGIFTHGFLEEALCPTGEMESGMCTNRRVRLVLEVIVHVFVGLSAITVELAAAATAPAFRERTAWATFAIGGVVAAFLGIAAGAYGELATALMAALVTAIVITRHPR